MDINVSIIKKMTRYGLTSVLAVGSDIGLMWLLASSFGVPYLTAAAIGFGVGCVVKYLVSKYMVFENTTSNAETLTIALFMLIAVIGLSANHLIIYIGVEYLDTHLLAAKIFSAGFVFLMNFFLLGFFVFKDPEVTSVIQTKSN